MRRQRRDYTSFNDSRARLIVDSDFLEVSKVNDNYSVFSPKTIGDVAMLYDRAS